MQVSKKKTTYKKFRMAIVLVYKDMRARWNPTDIWLGMGGYNAPKFVMAKCNATNKQTIIDQLRSEMFAISHRYDAVMQIQQEQVPKSLY